MGALMEELVNGIYHSKPFEHWKFNHQDTVWLLNFRMVSSGKEVGSMCRNSSIIG